MTEEQERAAFEAHMLSKGLPIERIRAPSMSMFWHIWQARAALSLDAAWVDELTYSISQALGGIPDVQWQAVREAIRASLSPGAQSATGQLVDQIKSLIYAKAGAISAAEAVGHPRGNYPRHHA